MSFKVACLNFIRMTGVVVMLTLSLSSADPVEAQKESPPPQDKNSEQDGPVQTSEHPGYEVWVDVSTPEQSSQPKSMQAEYPVSLLAPSTTVVINEFDQIDDSIEFFNISAGVVDMSGWLLVIYYGSNLAGNIYTFPAGFTLSSGSYVVLHESGNPADNSATDLYSGENFILQALGGALALIDNTATGVDFVRWNVGMITPPSGTGWVGANASLPEAAPFSLGRDAASLDRDYGEDWTLQSPSFGAQNDPSAPLCVQLWLVSSGAGTTPTNSPDQSAGCPIGYFTPGEVVTLTANPDPGWEVGQWGETPATEYLGTGLVLDYTMTIDHSSLWVSYIQSSPAPGTALLMGLWGDYNYTLEDLGVSYDQISSHTFAPDWDVLNRYDLLVYQTFEGEPFYLNLRGSNFATYLDEGGCMWVEADTYDQEPDAYAPEVLYYYFGVNSFGADFMADTITGTGTVFSGLGPFDDPDDEYYADLTPYNGAEVAFEDISGFDIGVTKDGGTYHTALISFDYNNLARLEQAAILAAFLDACSIPHTTFAYPTNDDFDTPIVIGSLNYSNSQGALSIMQATTAGDDPAMEDTNKYYHTVWYRYTAAVSEEITVDTFGSDYDTVLGVWTGSRGSLTEVVVNDDYSYPDVLQSQAVFTASAGTTYYIEIASWNTGYGELNLHVSGSSSLLFVSDFEEGDLLEWSRYNDGGGWLTACNEAAMNGSWGACIFRGDNDNRKQLIDDTPVDQTSFSVRFNLDINSFSMPEGTRFRFLEAKRGLPRTFFLVLRRLNGLYQIQFNILVDDGLKYKSAWYNLSDAPHAIEIDWQASSGPGVNDGFIQMFMDNGLLEEMTGLDNDTFIVSSLRIGFVSRLDGSPISGVWYLDDVATSNNGYIGLP
jgi:hypothetical protein